MAEPHSGATSAAKPLDDRLDSWKEIAAYLNRDVTTVQRWEKREGMPVHRHQHDRMGSVYAFRSELNSWSSSRNPTPPETATPSAAPPAQKSRFSLRMILPLAMLLAVALGTALWMTRTDRFWRSPIADARVQTVTDFDGVEEQAALSRDGKLIAFLSDRDGQTDVWITQSGSGEFHNLTRGRVSDLSNPLVRLLGFSPDGAFVTFWQRRQTVSGTDEIGIWAVPTLGGEPKPYLEGVAEYDWNKDTSKLAYHTPGAGDPLYISTGTFKPSQQPVFTAPTGMHSHFPLWSPDSEYIYFVMGSVPDKFDIWRLKPDGGQPERITSQNTRITYPVFLNPHTLLYLATNPDGSGPSLYSIDPDRRIPHQLTFAPDRYTSLATSADGKRLVLTLASTKRTLWRIPVSSSPETMPAPTPISLTTTLGFSPRLGPGYLLYVSATGNSESIWKSANGDSTDLWRGDNVQIIGGPAISRNGRQIAFSVRQNGRTLLYRMDSDGTSARMVTDALDLHGSLAWAPDGQSIVSAANVLGVPQLFRIPLDGKPAVPLVKEFSTDPVWSPDGEYLLYSGPDVGTNFSVKAVSPDGTPRTIIPLQLTRGARHFAFLPAADKLVYLRGDIQHKDLWEVDLQTGTERQLTNLGPEFDILDFDVSPDGQQIVLERVQERSDIVLMDLRQK